MATLDCEVLIVGAGPTGLTAACELARRGIQVRIIDARSGPTTESRALGVHARTLELLEKLSLADEVIACGQRLRGVELGDSRGPIGQVTFEADDTRYPFVISVPQSETERLLLSRLAQFGVSVERNTSLIELREEGGQVEAKLTLADGTTHCVNAAWLIGCDGAHSATRKQLGVTFEGARMPQWFALADVNTDWPLSHDRIHVFLHHDGPLAIFPLPGENLFRLIAELPAETNEAPEVSSKLLETIIAERAGRAVQLPEPVWASSFLITRRLVNRYRVGRVFLAGDAAHLHSPVGGQGMNTGIQDAFNLSWKLALVLRGQAPDSLLDSYQAERHPIGLQTLRKTRLATAAVTLKNPLAQRIRAGAVHVATRIPGFQRRLFHEVNMTAIAYPESALIVDANRSAGLTAGRRAPDFEVEPNSGGKTLRLYELLKTTKHVLVSIGGDSPERSLATELGDDLRELAREFEPVLDCYQVQAAGDGTTGGLGGPTALGYANGEMYLIRPDGYIGWRGAASDLKSLREYLSGWFSPTPKETPVSV